MLQVKKELSILLQQGQQQPVEKRESQYNSMAEKAALYAAGAAAAYKHQYDEYLAQQQGYNSTYKQQDSSYNMNSGTQSNSRGEHWESGYTADNYGKADISGI